MDQEKKQAESLIALYQKDRLELYSRIAEADKKIAKFEQFIKFIDLIDKEMDKDDAKNARAIMDKYSTFKESAIKEQAERIEKKIESHGWLPSFPWWSSTPAAPPTTPEVPKQTEPAMEEFTVIKSGQKIDLPEIPEETPMD